jgi:hypothetical protein
MKDDIMLYRKLAVGSLIAGSALMGGCGIDSSPAVRHAISSPVAPASPASNASSGSSAAPVPASLQPAVNAPAEDEIVDLSLG